MNNNIEKLLDSLSKSKFRGSFHLNKKMKEYVKEKGMKKETSVVSLIISILIGIAIIILNIILKNFDWHLRSWMITLAPALITLGIATLGYISLNTIRKDLPRVFFMIVWTIICLIIISIEFFLWAWIVKSDAVKEIDGTKYVGVEYYSNRMRKTVIYYKEFNIFAYHETKEYIEEFYEHDNYDQPEYRRYHKENYR